MWQKIERPGLRRTKGESRMDWIERVFHLAPDGGNGSLEIGIVAGAAVALAMVVGSVIKLTPALKRWLAPLARCSGERSPATRGDG
jgi:hypothetical protein